MTTLYSCKSEIDGDGTQRWRITKFDDDMNVESSYLTTHTECDCPAGVRPLCRHRAMLHQFLARGAVNTMWMLDFDRNGWVSSQIQEAELEPPLSCTEAEHSVEQNTVPAQTFLEQYVEMEQAISASPRPTSITLNRRGF